MNLSTRFVHAIATCLLFLFTMAVVVPGCGETSAPTDEESKAKAQEAEAKVKEVHSKKRLP